MDEFNQMANILIVVHRDPSFPGGSEKLCGLVGKGLKELGHNVTYFVNESKGDRWNDCYVTRDPSIIFENWDLIVVHGSCPAQDVVHFHSDKIYSPIYYMIIQPSEADIPMKGMKYAKWLGCATSRDIDHCIKHGYEDKIRRFDHGIEQITPIPGFREKAKLIKPKYILAAGGFWPNKGFEELINIFDWARPHNLSLVLLGYDNREGWAEKLPPHPDVIKFMAEDPQDVYDAMLEAEVFIQNSTSEGYGLTILEAMSMGTEWFSTDVGVSKDLWKKGFGHIVDKKTLRWKLKRLDQSFDLNGGKSLAKTPEYIEYIKNNHTYQKMTDQIISVLEEGK